MRRIVAALGGTTVASFLLVASVAAVDPTASPSPAATTGTGPLPAVLGLSQAEIRDFRHDGMSIAQIAAKQAVTVEKVVAALVTQWQERIDARVASGALTADQAAALKTQLQTRATTMVNSTAPGGMRGASVGAGPRSGAGNGSGQRGPGTGTGTCDGTGPHGPGRP